MNDKQKPATLDECFEAAELLQDVAVRDKPRGDTQAALDEHQRIGLIESADWLEDCAEGMDEEGLDRENNARHFRTGANAIRAALTAQPAESVDGIDLNEALCSRDYWRDTAHKLSEQLSQPKQPDVNAELLEALKDIANGKWIKNEQLSIEAGQDMFTTDAKTIAKQAIARAEQKGQSHD